MKVPFWYKGSGALQKDTLNNAPFTSYKVVLKFFKGKSADLFGFRTTRTTLSNQFNSSLDIPEPRKTEQVDKCIITHYPMTEDTKLSMLNRPEWKSRKKYRVVLIDPPFTPTEDSKLYGENKTLQDVQEMYYRSCKWAWRKSNRCVIVYGYKIPPPGKDWRLAALFGTGGGSHPTQLGALYLSLNVSKDTEKQLITALHSFCSGIKKCKNTYIRVIRDPLKCSPHNIAWRVGKRVGNRVYLFGRQDELTNWIHAVGQKAYATPTRHPTYLSKGMMAVSREKKALTVYGSIAWLYSQVGGKPCFSSKRFKSISVYRKCDEPLGDVNFAVSLKAIE